MDEFRGRKKIYTDVTRIDASNVIQVLTDALIEHSTNREQIEYLMNYEKGIQPILGRQKDIRPEINIKVVENNAAKIADFKVSYEFGSPITYIQRSSKQAQESDAGKDDIRITALNEMLLEESKSSMDVELARYFKICGVGYRMIKAKPFVYGKSVFDILTLNPLTTFVVYSNDVYQRPMLAVTYSVQKNGSTLYGCYTNDTYFEIDNGTRIINGFRQPLNYTIKNPAELRPEDRRGEALIPQIIPIVEYINDYDRMGCFEKVLSELDAINIINSDRVNDIAQHVQSLLWMNNCELPDGETIHPGGIIQTKTYEKNVQANIQFLQDELNQAGIQTIVDHMHSKIMQITNVPLWQENSGGGSTGSAMNLSSGRQDAETAALCSESIFEKSERQSIRIMLEIIKKSTDIPEEIWDITNLQISDIMIKHGRNKIYDIATKSNALNTLINTGINGKHAIETVSLFTDPQSVWNDSKEMIMETQATKAYKQNKLSSNGDTSMADQSDQPQKSPFSNI